MTRCSSCEAYVKTNKHDAADAEAICEAVQRPGMRYVAVKDEHQQSMLMLLSFLVPFVAVAALAWRIRPTRQVLVACATAAASPAASGMGCAASTIWICLQGTEWP